MVGLGFLASLFPFSHGKTTGESSFREFKEKHPEVDVSNVWDEFGDDSIVRTGITSYMKALERTRLNKWGGMDGKPVKEFGPYKYLKGVLEQRQGRDKQEKRQALLNMLNGDLTSEDLPYFIKGENLFGSAENKAAIHNFFDREERGALGDELTKYGSRDGLFEAFKNEGKFKEMRDSGLLGRILPYLHHTPAKSIGLLKMMVKKGYKEKHPILLAKRGEKEYGVMDGGHRLATLLFALRKGLISDSQPGNISFVKFGVPSKIHKRRRDQRNFVPGNIVPGNGEL